MKGVIVEEILCLSLVIVNRMDVDIVFKGVMVILKVLIKIKENNVLVEMSGIKLKNIFIEIDLV